ncbi:MAG: hypothetical protein COA51_08645 [Idiomarina sp.]|nr:MAG: hypothetical protein COA51_08645 [Idiomarina sp.]
MTQIVTLKQLIGYARRVGAAVILLLAATACSPAPSGLMQLHDYQQRVANTLSREAIPYQPQTPQQIPAARELRVTIPRLQLSLLDSMRLDTCRAGSLIAERNSSLGRLTSGVMRYYHDRELLDALYDCAEQLETSEPELAQRVRQLAQAKQATMPQLRMQAIVSDDSLRNVLRKADRALPEVEGAQLAPLFQAFNIILNTLNNDAELPAENQLEQALEALAKSAYLSQLWRALFDNQQYLQQLNPLVINISAEAGCLSKGVPERARVLRQVFIARFSDPVQQHISALVRQAQQLEAYLDALYAEPELLQTQPTLVKWNNYLRHIAALDDQLVAETRNHVEFWQQLFTDCEFTPGA